MFIVCCVHSNFAFAAMQVFHLATHPYGCRVVQRALEHANVAQCRRLLDELLLNTYELVQVRVWCEKYLRDTFQKILVFEKYVSVFFRMLVLSHAHHPTPTGPP